VKLQLTENKDYRPDIDGLRAVAVIAVILFHLGVLPNGYLGVDVFFVISGYLITGIIARELQEGRFSIIGFYIRRTRRILPLTLCLVLVALITGIIVMLPDDLENLAQSVVATNLFANNVLQAFTTKNYWDVVNEFKPLMHTWSLGVEEQYYIAYPLLIFVIGAHFRRLLLPALAVLALVSLGAYFIPLQSHVIFYHLPFRFFELAFGGIAALWLGRKLVVHRLSPLLIGGLVVLMCLPPGWLPEKLALLAAVALSTGVIATANGNSRISAVLLENKVTVGIGLISFSLYMWHQVILAYTRYFVVQRLEGRHIAATLLLIFALSTVTYFLVEQPFRNKRVVRTGTLFAVVGFLFIITTLPAFYIYSKGGIIKDIPELGISKTEARRNLHAEYNSRIYKYDKPFAADGGKIKVLVLGNSFARDWANVLLESRQAEKLELSYAANLFSSDEVRTRSRQADIIFYNSARKNDVKKLGIDESKLFVAGTKSFGFNCGYFYNYSGADYFGQRTIMEPGYLEYNELLKREWGERYLDLIGKVMDLKNTMPVFTPDKMFISQDCRHFTEAGARYFAALFENELAAMFASAGKRE